MLKKVDSVNHSSQKDALTELFEIIEIKGSDERLVAFEQWKKDWIYEIEKTQYVINKSTMGSEEVDFAWYWVAKLCGEALMDEQLFKTHSTNNTFTASLTGLRNEKQQKSAKSSVAPRRD